MLISDGFLRGYSPLLVSSAFSFAAIMRAAPAYVGRLSRDRMNDSVLSEFPPMNEIFKSVIGFGDSGKGSNLAWVFHSMDLSSALILLAVSPFHVLALERKYLTMPFPESYP